MFLNRLKLFAISLFLVVECGQYTASNNFISGLMYKIVENEMISSNTRSWFAVKSNVYCCAFCLRDASCTGFQFGDVVDANVTTTSCELLYENVSLLTREPQPGMTVYSLERDQKTFTTATSEMTPQDSASTTPLSGATTPASVTTAPIPEMTTLPPFGPCVADAAFARQTDIVIISGAWVHIYNASNYLVIGPVESIPLQTFLPGWTGTVDAAYTDEEPTNLYMIAGNEVKTYRLDDNTLVTTETTTQHFSMLSIVGLPDVIDAAVYYKDEVILIGADVVYSPNGSLPLSTQTSANVFNYINTTITSPTGITAVGLSWSAKSPLFFARGIVYIYAPDYTLWFNKGDLKCEKLVK